MALTSDSIEKTQTYAYVPSSFAAADRMHLDDHTATSGGGEIGLLVAAAVDDLVLFLRRDRRSMGNVVPTPSDHDKEH